MLWSVRDKYFFSVMDGKIGGKECQELKWVVHCEMSGLRFCKLWSSWLLYHVWWWEGEVRREGVWIGFGRWSLGEVQKINHGLEWENGDWGIQVVIYPVLVHDLWLSLDWGLYPHAGVRGDTSILVSWVWYTSMLVSWVWVSYSGRNVRESGVVDKKFFLFFCSYTAVDVSCENVVMITVKVFRRVWGGGVKRVRGRGKSCWEWHTALVVSNKESTWVIFDLIQ